MPTSKKQRADEMTKRKVMAARARIRDLERVLVVADVMAKSAEIITDYGEFPRILESEVDLLRDLIAKFNRMMRELEKK